MDVLNDTLINGSINGTATVISPGGTFLASAVLFLLAIIPIYFGSYLSQKYLDKENLEVLSFNDAAKFPVYASAALFGIYLLFKILPSECINLLVNLHFSFIGIGSMAHCFCPLLKKYFPGFLPNHQFKIEFTRSNANSEDNSNTPPKVLDHHSIEFTSKDSLGFAVALLIGTWYFLSKHWIANNFIALTICILAIKYIRLNKFVNGFLLLGGLFFYDIFWVFGTPVMVSVAKSLDAPIKVTFPRDFLTNGFFGKQMALLGLGDIVVPGIFIAMLLRFDHSLKRNGCRLYFYTGYAAYIVGLLTTFIVMHTFNAAQPALLYLVPTCLGFPSLVALIHKDFGAMLSYQDMPEEETANATEPTKSE